MLTAVLCGPLSCARVLTAALVLEDELQRTGYAEAVLSQSFPALVRERDELYARLTTAIDSLATRRAEAETHLTERVGAMMAEMDAVERAALSAAPASPPVPTDVKVPTAAAAVAAAASTPAAVADSHAAAVHSARMGGPAPPSQTASPTTNAAAPTNESPRGPAPSDQPNV
jgi:hypothetical protein